MKNETMKKAMALMLAIVMALGTSPLNTAAEAGISLDTLADVPVYGNETEPPSLGITSPETASPAALAVVLTDVEAMDFRFLNFDSEFNIQDGPVNINVNGNYRIFGNGTQTANRIIVSSGVIANITVENVNINAASAQQAAFDMAGATVNLTILGTNRLSGNVAGAGIRVPAGATLTITDESTGTLNAIGVNGGAGIGGNGPVTGDETGGTIIINGGTIIAEAVSSTVNGGAGIGGGGGNHPNGGNGGNVIINGGTVIATGATRGAGIGGGTITSGSGGHGGTVTITGGTVTATGGHRAAGIGGSGNSALNPDGNGGNVIITGGSVRAVRGTLSTQDIGGGANSANHGTLTSDGTTPVFLNTLTTAPQQNNATVTGGNIHGASGFGFNDVQTDASGRLYFYLPATGTGMVSVNIGGDTFSRTYTRPNNHNNNTATLFSANNPPVITINQHPANQTFTQGNISGSLSVTASATHSAPISYQWFVNTVNNNTGGTPIDGATNASFTIPTNLTVGTYFYYVVVSVIGTAISVPSGVATVTINPVLVTAASITGVTSPVAGATPSTAINNGIGFTSTLSWDGNPTTFGHGTVYTARITLAAANDFTFSGGFGNTAQISGFTVNGIAPVWISNNGTTLVFTVAFPQTAAPTITLNPASVTINDATLSATSTVTGTATGEITLNTNFLPTSVTAAVNQTTGVITVIGVRPQIGGNAINDNFNLGVTRQGITQNLTVNVNLTPLQPDSLTGTAIISNTTPRIGDVLTGSLTGGNNTGTLTYTWRGRAGNVVIGTGASYTVAAADYGYPITLEITSSVETGSVTSVATALVLRRIGPAAPASPQLQTATYNTITLVPNSAHEFRIGSDGIWQSSNIFGGLSPDTDYIFYQRIAQTTDAEASAASAGAIFRTAPAPQVVLLGVATISNTTPRIGDVLIGSLIGGNNTGILTYTWRGRAGNVVIGTGVSYTVAAADYGYPITLEITSSVETGSVTSVATALVLRRIGPAAPASPQLQTATYNTITLVPNSAHEFRIGSGGTWQSSNIFGGLSPDTDYIFYQRIAQTIDTEASAASAGATFRTETAPAGALLGTAIISNTTPRIGDVLTGSLVGGNNTGTLTYTWRANGVVIGSGSSLTVILAHLGQPITLEITSSVETGTATSAATAAVLRTAGPSAPSAPTYVSVTYNTVTLTPNAAHEFSINNGATWQSSNVFSGLTPQTAYSFVQRIAQTADTEASATSLPLNVTTAAAIIPLTFYLGQPTATISDASLSTTITTTGTATGDITFNRGALPTAVTLEQSPIGNGVIITGTRPAAGQSAITGQYTVTVTRQSINQTLTVNVNLTPLPPVYIPTQPIINTISLPTGTVGITYNQTLNATGSSPIAWSIATGNLPSGLNLSTSSGAISGTPTTAGTFSFTVRAENTAGHDIQALSITINHAQAQTFTITFNGNGGTPAIQTRQTGTDGRLGYLPNVNRSNHHFDGWFTTAGQIVTTNTVFIVNTTVTARWTYTGSGNNNDGGWWWWPSPTVTSVSITPSSATVERGQQWRFSASVAGNNSPSQSVTWTVEGGVAGTTISSTGLLTVAANETAATLTVRARSTANTAISGTVIVTVAQTTPVQPGDSQPALPPGREPEEIELPPIQDDDPPGGTPPDPDADMPVQPFINPFADVNEDDWFFDSVAFVYQNGLMRGPGNGLFLPNVTSTRAMIIQVLFNLEGRPDVSHLDNPFTDVSNYRWYADAIIWAQSVGIVSGFGNGIFRPSDNITRAHLAVILNNYARFAGIDLPILRDNTAFADDSDINSYARESIIRFFQAGIINGKPGNIFDPNGDATRVQMAAMLHRFIEAANSEVANNES